jgi:hypothetical protein
LPILRYAILISLALMPSRHARYFQAFIDAAIICRFCPPMRWPDASAIFSIISRLRH